MKLLTKPLEKPNCSLSTPRPTDSIRLEKAAGLLRDTALPVSCICYRCGFADLNNFDKAFRKEFHCAPGTYRTECRACLPPR